MNYYVKAEWDPETSVWFVSDSNVPGLCTEAASTEELFRKLDQIIPELVTLNGGKPQQVPFELFAHRASTYSPCH